MVFSISVFLLSWTIYIFTADKNKFFKFAPTCYVAIILSLITELLTHHNYPLWDYPAATEAMTFIRHILDSFGVYFVVTYLFLQTLPQKQTLSTLAKHIFPWTILALLLEWVAVNTGNMKYGLWWNLGFSYLADWLLFILFFSYYRWQGSRN